MSIDILILYLLYIRKQMFHIYISYTFLWLWSIKYYIYSTVHIVSHLLNPDLNCRSILSHNLQTQTRLRSNEFCKKNMYLGCHTPRISMWESEFRNVHLILQWWLQLKYTDGISWKSGVFFLNPNSFAKTSWFLLLFNTFWKSESYNRTHELLLTWTI